ATATDCGLLPTVAVENAFENSPLPKPWRTDTEPPPALVTTRSSRPSLLKSPIAMELGLFPVPGVAAKVKPPLPLPRKMLTVLLPLLTTARSALPSPLNSPTTTAYGEKIWLVRGVVAKKVPSPLPRKMLTELLAVELLATARSNFPSPLKSPTATERGFTPVAGEDIKLKVPSPWPRKTLTVLLFRLAAARAVMPSPLKSPVATDQGRTPVPGEVVAAKPVPATAVTP